MVEYNLAKVKTRVRFSYSAPYFYYIWLSIASTLEAFFVLRTIMRNYQWSELDAIIFELKMNKAGVLKTDTLYGLIALNPHVIYEVKKRPTKKRLISFISEIEQIPHKLPDDLLQLITEFWPGPLTIIYKKNSYRMPNCQQLLNLINIIGPVYSSSANLSGDVIAKNLDDIIKQLQPKIYKLIFINDHEQTLSFINSTIYDYDNKTVVRIGEIDIDDIQKFVTIKKIFY